MPDWGVGLDNRYSRREVDPLHFYLGRGSPLSMSSHQNDSGSFCVCVESKVTAIRVMLCGGVVVATLALVMWNSWVTLIWRRRINLRRPRNRT